LSDAASYKPLAILRIGTAAVLLLQAVVLWKYRDLLLAEYGPVPWMVSGLFVDPWLPKLSDFAPLAGRVGIGSAGLVELVLLVHAAAAAALLAGWHTRSAAIVTWATYVPLKTTGFLFTYGIGGMLLIALFYCVVMPVGRAWSVDERRAPAAVHPGEDAALAVLVLRIHVSLIYLGAGVSKAVGPQWWSGDAVWRALSLPQFQQFDPAPLAGYPLLLQAAAIVALASQLLYPALVWTRARVFIVVLTELIHLGIAVFLGLWLFSAMMMVLNAAAFGEAVWNALDRRLRARRFRRTAAAE
jgi:hypothetical protein